MTRYVAMRGKTVVVDELYNLQDKDNILGEVSANGQTVLPRVAGVMPMERWWPSEMFSGPAVKLVDFVRKLTDCSGEGVI